MRIGYPVPETDDRVQLDNQTGLLDSCKILQVSAHAPAPVSWRFCAWKDWCQGCRDASPATPVVPVVPVARVGSHA